MGTVGSGWSTCVARIYMMSVLLVYAVYYDHRYQDGASRHAAASEFPAHVEAGTTGISGGDAIWNGSRRIRGVHGVDRQIRRGSSGEPSGGAQHCEPHVHGAAWNRVRCSGASGAGARARRSARSEPRRMDGFGAGNELHVLHGSDFIFDPRFNLAHIYARSGGDPCGRRALVRSCVLPAFDGMQTVATGALRGAGDTRTPMLCHLILYWGIGLPLGAYLCFRFVGARRGYGQDFAPR